MRGKLLKKLIAGIASIAILAGSAVVPVAVQADDATVVYERGTTTAWSETDISEWKTSWATPVIDSNYGLKVEKNTGGSINKTFSVTEDSIVTYNVDFYVKGSTGRTNNYAYVQFGSEIRVGQNSDYKLFYSTDCGSNYSSSSIKTVGSGGGTTNIVAVVNTKTDTLVSLSVDGTEVTAAAETSLADDATYNSVALGFTRAGSVGWSIPYAIEAIQVSEKPDTTTYYTVTYNVDGTESSESVADGDVVAKIPDTAKTGYIFNGWAKDGNTTNLLSSDEIKSAPVTADVTYTAVYDKDASYVEKIVSAEITGPTLMTIGADADTAAANNYSVVLTGEFGSTITKSNLHENVTDFSVAWDIDGFKTENDVADNSYCDYYGGFALKTTGDVNATFNLRKNASMNFFGMLTATVTYNGETIKATKPVVAISNTDVPSNQVLPEAGYPSDMNDYPDSLVRYTTSRETYNDTVDSIVGGWNVAGSDGNRSATLTSDETGKFIRVKGGSSGSRVFNNPITSPASQLIFEYDIRYNTTNGTVSFSSGNPFWTQNGYALPVAVSYNGSVMKLNGTELAKDGAGASISTKTWYKVVLSVDKTNETCFAKVYNTDGTLLGEAQKPWSVLSCNPTYFGVTVENGTVDVNNIRAYYPTADMSSYTLTTTANALSIEEGDTATLSAAVTTAEGYPLTGVATWTVLEDEMKAGVIVTADESDSHKATVTLTDAAVAGIATVQVNIGGYTKTVELNITSTEDSIKFTKSAASVAVPFDGTNTAEFSAIVIDGNGADTGRDVTLAVYDENNSEEYNLPTGITFDNNKLKVSSGAQPCAFVVRATGKNSDGEDISRYTKVTVYGYSFDFGTAQADDGYTSVTADTVYTDAKGYGITGTVTGAEDSLNGALTFKTKVDESKIYTVEVTYKGSLGAEPVNSELTACSLGSQTELVKAIYTVPVIDDVLELVLTDYTYTVDDKGTEDKSDDETATVPAQIASIVITKNADKEPDTKPGLYIIGDSTLSNNGSWGHWLNNNKSKFPELYAAADVHICGRGGSNLRKYYTSGDFFSKILLNVRPGDIVSLGNMGTNGGATALFEDSVNYYLDAAEALGAKIILHSYSPHGPVKGSGYESGYDSATQTFNSYRKDTYDNIIRAVAEERAASDENYLGFVDIGKRADAAYNAYVNDYAANGYESRDAAAQVIISKYSDHNHYSGIAAELMVAGYGDAEGTVQGILDVIMPYVNSTPTVNVTAEQVATSSDAGSTPAAAYMAEFDDFTGYVNSITWTINKADASDKLVKEEELDGTYVTGSDIVFGAVITVSNLDLLGTVTATLN